MQPSDLRQRAEELVRKAGRDLSVMPVENVYRLVQELEVHQIELNLQNEELRKTQLELEVSRDEYFDLYDFAPTGYLTLEPSGIILNANLRTAMLLEMERASLIHTKLSYFIAPAETEAFSLHLQQVLADEATHTCELQMRKHRGTMFYARLESVGTRDAEGNKNQCRTALIDITERKQAEEDLRHSYEQLWVLTRELKEKEEKERKQFAGELHEEFGQSLTSLMLDLAWVSRRLSTMPSSSSRTAIQAKITSMVGLVDQTGDAVRRMASSIRPSVLDDLGLVAALEWLAQECQARSGIRSEVVLGPQVADKEIPEGQSTTLFRIAQELSTNVMRHSQASEMRISLSEEGEWLVLSVKDNGIGVAQSSIDHPKSFGILGIRERASLLGGECTIVGKPGKGTTATIRLP